VPLDAAVGHGETELPAILAAGMEIDPGQSQPANGEVFERMTDFEDAQRAAGKLGPIHRRIGILELQGTLAGNSRRGGRRRDTGASPGCVLSACSAASTSAVTCS
jgi:hypothetical protein